MPSPKVWLGSAVPPRSRWLRVPLAGLSLRRLGGGKGLSFSFFFSRPSSTALRRTCSERSSAARRGERGRAGLCRKNAGRPVAGDVGLKTAAALTVSALRFSASAAACGHQGEGKAACQCDACVCRQRRRHSERQHYCTHLGLAQVANPLADVFDQSVHLDDGVECERRQKRGFRQALVFIFNL